MLKPLFVSLTIIFAGCPGTTVQQPSTTDATPRDGGARDAATQASPDAAATADDASTRDDATTGDASTTADDAAGMPCTDPPVAIDGVTDFVGRAHLVANGPHVALAFREGFNAPHSLNARIGDGVTFGAPVEIFPNVRSNLRSRDVAITQDGKLGVAMTDAASAARRVLEGTTLGPASAFVEGGSDCYAPMIAAGTQLFHLHQHTMGSPEGVDYARAMDTTWATTASVGSGSARPDSCDLALDSQANGVAVWAAGSSPVVAARAFRAGAPIGPTVRVPIPTPSVHVVRAVTQASGEITVIAGGNQTFYEIRLSYDAPANLLNATAPVQIEPSAASDRAALVGDDSGNLTLAWYGDGDMRVLRRIGGAWQPAQVVGSLNGMVDEKPELRIDQDGNVALLYTAGRGTFLARGTRTSATLGPLIHVKDGQTTATHALLPDGRVLVAWATLVAPGDVLAVYCR